MLKIFELLQMLAGLIPLIHQSVLTAEAIFPKANSGLQKLDHVVSSANAALGVIGASAEQVQQLAPAIKGIVDTTVKGLNDSGLFKRDDATAL